MVYNQTVYQNVNKSQFNAFCKIFIKVRYKEPNYLFIFRKLLKGRNSVNQITYCETLKLLLQFEEVALKNSIREFDCEYQTLSRIPGIPDLLSLNVRYI